jgi:Protein of unknown function (DUF1441)
MENESSGFVKDNSYNGENSKPFVAPRGYETFCGISAVAAALSTNTVQAKTMMAAYPATLIDGKSYWTIIQVVNCAISRHSVSTDNPAEMTPNVRKDYYDAELKRIKFEQEMGNLVFTSDALQTFSAMTKSVAGFLETLPDVLERDVDLTGEQVQQMQKAIDVFRTTLFEAAE